MIVVKVGGSLYDHPRLGPGLRAYLASLGEPVLLVPGGGPFADVVRRLQPIHGISDAWSHWISLAAMDSARVFLTSLGVDAPSMKAVDFGRLYVSELPPSWDLTSDSIAAAMASYGDDNMRLILLKSIDIPAGTSWPEAAANGWVDPYFPKFVAKAPYPVEVVNFRKYLDSFETPG